MEQFNIPITLFFFKREEKTLLIIEQIARVKPRKLYLISDGPRNEEERERVLSCREKVESLITWPCEVVRDYALENKGVYNRIGEGAKWVLSREKYSIFLEDDNLPEISFFYFCEDLLSKYENDNRILWICGTNYLKEYYPPDGSSYVFTKHMLPCGWASWANKFGKYYDGELNLWNDPYIKRRIKYEYSNKALFKQDRLCWNMEDERIKRGERPISWDYQMSFTLRVHGLYGIVPCFNQIRNIGVDLDSIHGGSSFDNPMVKRFCGLPTKPMDFPMLHPKVVLPDNIFEKRTAKIILYPLKQRIIISLGIILKKIFRIEQREPLLKTLKKRITSSHKKK